MYALNDPEVYKAYFEDIAKKNKKLLHSNQKKHFYPFDSEEVESGLRGKEIQYPALVLEYPESSITGPNISQLNESITGAFFILLPSCKAGDFSAINASLKISKDIGYEVLSKMRKDVADRTLLGFDPRNVRIMKIGPLFDIQYFYRFEFDLTVQVNDKLCYDETKWMS